MTRSKIDAFFKEFPFLGNFFTKESVEEIKVARISEETLDLTPDVRMNGEIWKPILFLDRDGHKLLEVGVRTFAKKWYDPTTWSGVSRSWERISGGLERMGQKSDAVRYILQFDRHNGHLTIYKTPKNLTIREWLVSINQNNAIAARQSVAEVDNV